MIHNGKKYEIDKLYFCNETSQYGLLNGMDGDAPSMINGSKRWLTEDIEPVRPDFIGKVEDTPIELEEGCWYMCEINGFEVPFLCVENGFKTPYGTSTKDGPNLSFGECTPLYKMERAK